jgi:hypothetical protein
VISSALTTSKTAEVVVDSYERVRKLYCYGLFEYELSTVARDQAVLLLELALRERVVTLYGGRVALVSLKSAPGKIVQSDDFEVVYKVVARGGWTVKPRSGALFGNGQNADFKGGLPHLLRWARQEKLITGQRAAFIEPLWAKERIWAAHPHYHLGGPGEAALTINDVGEFINRLWGHRTKGGRLYPAPVERTTKVVAWNDGGSSITAMPPGCVPEFNQPGDWTFIVLLAGPDDDRIFTFDARYERTQFPADLLWGPSDKQGTVVWLTEHGAVTDECDSDNQLLAVQATDGKTYLPRRHGVALGLDPHRRTGTWYLLRTHHALHAFNYVRSGGGQAVEQVFKGTWEGTAEAPDVSGVAPVQARPVWVPRLRVSVAPDVGCD